MNQVQKKQKKKLPVKLVAWGNNYPAAKRAFVDKALELRIFGQGVDPGLKDGKLFFDVSIYWVFSNIQKEEKTKKTFKPDFLKNIFHSIHFKSFVGYGWDEDYKHFFPSAVAFLEICYKYNLCFGLYEYEQKFHPKIKKQEAYVVRIWGNEIRYTANNQLIKYLPHKDRISCMPENMYEKLIPGDKIEIVYDEKNEKWKISKIL